MLAIDEVIYTRILQRDWAMPAGLEDLLGLTPPPQTQQLSSSGGKGNEQERGVRQEGESGEGSAEQGTCTYMCDFVGS